MPDRGFPGFPGAELTPEYFDDTVLGAVNVFFEDGVQVFHGHGFAVKGVGCVDHLMADALHQGGVALCQEKDFFQYLLWVLEFCHVDEFDGFVFFEVIDFEEDGLNEVVAPVWIFEFGEESGAHEEEDDFVLVLGEAAHGVQEVGGGFGVFPG